MFVRVNQVPPSVTVIRSLYQGYLEFVAQCSHLVQSEEILALRMNIRVVEKGNGTEVFFYMFKDIAGTTCTA